jgi:hypothetical protein
VVRPEALLRLQQRQSGQLDLGHHCLIDRWAIAHFIRPVEVMGTHCPGHNHESFSICMVGGLGENGEAEDNYTNEQKDTLAYVLAGLLKDWPDVRVVHRRSIQKRKGDPADWALSEVTIQHALERARVEWPNVTPLTKAVKVRPAKPLPPKEIKKDEAVIDHAPAYP